MLFRIASIPRQRSISTFSIRQSRRSISGCLIPDLLRKEINNGGNSGGVSFSRPRAALQPLKNKFHSTASQNKRAYPSYTIFGETCVLSMKPIMPTYKIKGQEGDIIDVDQRGRMIFQFSPSKQGGIEWNQSISFALSPEELGLLITQLPFYPVKLTRALVGDGMGGGGYNMVNQEDIVTKTLNVTPGDGAAISFEIDYIKNGIGGQIPPSNSNEPNFQSAPLNVVVQAGEWECMKLIVQDSVPILLGWKKLMEVANDDAMSKSV